MEADIMTISSMIGTAIAALGGREAYERTRKRSPGSSPPPTRLVEQVHEIHTLAYTPDSDGVPLHARLTSAITQTARESPKQTELLRQILRALEGR